MYMSLCLRETHYREWSQSDNGDTSIILNPSGSSSRHRRLRDPKLVRILSRNLVGSIHHQWPHPASHVEDAWRRGWQVSGKSSSVRGSTILQGRCSNGDGETLYVCHQICHCLTNSCFVNETMLSVEWIYLLIQILKKTKQYVVHKYILVQRKQSWEICL